MKYDLEALRDQARGQWPRIVSRLAPEVYDAYQKGHRAHINCPMPSHGGDDDFRVFKDFEETGGAICTCGNFTDGFQVVRLRNNWSFPVVLKEVHEVLNGISSTNVVPFIPREKKEPEVDITKVKEALKRAIGASFPASSPEGSKLWTYFLNRGIWPSESIMDDLRYAPSMPYYYKKKFVGNYPCQLGIMRNHDGRAISIHRTYLSADCSGKADVIKPRKLMIASKPFDGAAIRLGAPTEVLGVAEGLETAYAVSQATGTTCWSCISATILGNFVPPVGVKRLVIWADKDRSGAGELYANKLKDRMLEIGIPTIIMLPDMEIPEGKKSIDWLDVVVTNSQDMHYLAKEVSYV